MSDNILEISDGNFETDVLKSDKPVLVDFWAPWCGPCKAIGPVIDTLSNTYEGRFLFTKCNVDDNPETPATYGIKAIPTLLFFNDGKLVDQLTGMIARGKIEESINNILSGQETSQPFVMQ